MKVFKWLEKIEEYAAYIFFLIAVVLSLYGVFMRYVMNKPQFSLLEIIEITMVWAIFIGFGRALKENHHIVVDIVYDKFPFTVKRVIAVISNLLGAGYSLYLTFGGLNMVAVAKSNGYVTNSDSIPIWLTYLILPVGMGLLCLYFLLKMFKAILGDKVEIDGIYSQNPESYISQADKERMSV